MYGPGSPRVLPSRATRPSLRRHDLDGQYAVFGQIIEGEDVPARLEVGDVIIRATVRPAS